MEFVISAVLGFSYAFLMVRLSGLIRDWEHQKENRA